MADYRSRRFLIDAIDERLGSVENEKRFDLAMILIGIILCAVGTIITCTVAAENSKIAILSLILALAGVALSYAMTKEYIADCKKAKKQ